MSFAASAHHPDAGTGETKATLRRRKSSSRTPVVAVLIGDLLVAASKIVAALWTGSAAMTSEAIHSVIDTTNEILLLYGIHRSKQKADADHPFGYGREIYFWSFVVSLLIFALGAGFSIYVGVNRILTPVPIESPVVSYILSRPRVERTLGTEVTATIGSPLRAKDTWLRPRCSHRHL